MKTLNKALKDVEQYINYNKLPKEWTKSKKLDVQAKAYLVEAISSELETEMNIIDIIKHCKNRFYSEYGWYIERYGLQKAIKEWLQGLAINIDFYNNDILNIAIKWGSIKDNATEKEEEKIISNWFNFMSCKLLQLFNYID